MDCKECLSDNADVRRKIKRHTFIKKICVYLRNQREVNFQEKKIK